MRNKSLINLFMPGRLCLFGEHSDWAALYNEDNPTLSYGEAIAVGIDQGIYATVDYDDNIVIVNNVNDTKFEIPLCERNLMQVTSQQSYYSIITGTCLYLLQHHFIKKTNGIKLHITKQTLPYGKGLSSSACIAALVVRAFNLLYDLNLSLQEEMYCAYRGERNTMSQCGRLDQVCVYGQKAMDMIFDGSSMDVTVIPIGCDLHYLIVDLKCNKSTKLILSDLNRCYPFAKNRTAENVQFALGKHNIRTVTIAKEYIMNGQAKELGRLMQQSQNDFDKYIAPASPIMLAEPILHQLLSDSYILDLTYGGKGVGSHGDGTAQFLCKDVETREVLKKYIWDKYRFNTYAFTLCKEV